MTKKILSVLLIVTMLFGVASCRGAVYSDATTTTTSAAPTQTEEGATQVAIEVKDMGTIIIELQPDKAPATCANFLKLVKSGFYDGLTFHRIIKGFMVQGGDPEGTGFGGSEESVKGEFSSNGFKTNDISHVRGVISMARSQNKDSASSQFFIVHKDSTFLDGDYAAFGHVVSGIEIVDKLAETPVQDANGTVDKADQPVMTKVYVVE
ncbi:MAG: peptidylprolyl isomerase [Clostridiales bacterium]|nr:peptidylprolyl isomerase [Clostridiales bacterium]